MKAEEIKSIQDCEIFCEGVLNEFESGILDKGETMKHLRDYTWHLHKMFEKKVNELNKTTDSL